MPVVPAPPTLATLINVVSDLPVADDIAQIISSTGVWENYFIRNSYDTDQHVFQLGITSPTGFQGGTVAFVQTAAPTLIWTCDWTATMQNGKPTIPNPTELADADWVLLHTLIEPETVELLPDGYTYVYTIHGTYWYGHANPAAAQMFFPKPAWLLDTNPMGRTVDASMFQPGLTDTPGNTGTSDDLEELDIVDIDLLEGSITRGSPPPPPLEGFLGGTPGPPATK